MRIYDISKFGGCTSISVSILFIYTYIHLVEESISSSISDISASLPWAFSKYRELPMLHIIHSSRGIILGLSDSSANSHVNTNIVHEIGLFLYMLLGALMFGSTLQGCNDARVSPVHFFLLFYRFFSYLTTCSACRN